MTHLAVAIDLNCDLLETADDKLLNLERVPIAAVAHGSGLTLGQTASDGGHEVRYVEEPFGREPDFGAVGVNYRLGDLWAQGSGRGEGLGCIGGQTLYILPLPRFLCMLWHSGAGTGDAACRNAFAAARD